MTTATRDRNGWPTATVTLDGGVYEAVITGIEGLAAQRETTADERVRGIESLDPPTARSADWNELVDLITEATDEAVRSTLGFTPTPGEATLVRLKVAQQVRGCLADLGVDS